MARRRIDRHDGIAAVRRSLAPGAAPDRRTRAAAVRFLLEELTAQAPGNSVEVRVPPFGVTQCVEGPRHTRGTPPNVVEVTAEVWLELATGQTDWEAARRRGVIAASGVRADLSAVLPLLTPRDLEAGDAATDPDQPDDDVGRSPETCETPNTPETPGGG